MNKKKGKKALSPISRRAFLKGGSAMVAGGLFLAGCPGGGGGYGDNCGYCDGSGRNYYHCDGDYCNYIDYSD